MPFELINDSALTIESILDSRRIGLTYEYLVHFKDSDNSNDSWVPLTDIPSTYDDLIEKFHRRHPKAPKPDSSILDRAPNVFEAPSDSGIKEAEAVDKSNHIHTTLIQEERSPNLQTTYTPPTCTTTRSGRISQPPKRPDDIISSIITNDSQEEQQTIQTPCLSLSQGCEGTAVCNPTSTGTQSKGPLSL